MMKGPSLDAIRKFKQQQEERKRQEDERKVQEKLTTLEHRAARGDKKAKSQLKQIEKVQEEKIKPPTQSKQLDNRDTYGYKTSRDRPAGSSHSSSSDDKSKNSARKLKNVIETDFEELMRLAKNNTNEIRRPQEDKPKEQPAKRIPVRHPKTEPTRTAPVSAVDRKEAPVYKKQLHASATNLKSIHKPASEPRPGISRNNPHSQKPPLQRQPPNSASTRHPQQLSRPRLPPPHNHLAAQQCLQRPTPPHHRLPPMRRSYYGGHDDYDDEDEDEYESDGFVVNEDDEEVQDELSKTLKSVFRYDKRRCDLREQELDRQYRAIGRVSTFEDLEREERRASRLAAIEDARAQREEDERKRLKKLRKSAQD